MTQEEIAVKLTEHHKEIGSIKHRMDQVEKQTDIIRGITHRTAVLEDRAAALGEKTEVIQGLAMSVNELAINMKAMLTEQEKQGKRIENLESVPANRWNTVITVTLTAVISGALTYLLTILL